jgi:hypothetical protein
MKEQAMTYVSAAALPVLPGQSDRVRNFAEELEPHLKEFERLNKEGTFTRFQVQLQESPEGDLAIYVFEVEDPSRIRSSFTSSDYDRWWLDFLRDVHGLDLRSLPETPMPPAPAYLWTRR